MLYLVLAGSRGPGRFAGARTAMAPIWEIVGGSGEGAGIVVRTGPEMRSPLQHDLLIKGAEVEELEIVGERLHYRKLEGTGPDEGWISISFGGKELAAPQKPPRDPPPTKVGVNEEAPLPVALFFPGQGSQYVKMLNGVQDIPEVQEMLEKAKDILGYDVAELCENGPEDKLEMTRYCQPAMFIGGLAGVEKLRAENPEAVTRASAMAGFSLGEYTALCAAGVLEFQDALKLVKLRGEAMHEAAEIGKQKMLSVVGLEQDKVEQLCKDAARKAGSGNVCQIAICLFPNGFSVGGSEKAIKLLQELCERAGAQQVRIVKTSGAFHTPLMQPALEKLSTALDEALPKMKSPLHTVWMNACAEPMRPGADPLDIVAHLKRQLTKPVLWEQSVTEMIKDDEITEFYECGPSKQLKAMMKRIDPNAWKTMESIEIGFKPRLPLPKKVGPNGESPLPAAIVFAGQGSQYVGMMEGVRDMQATKDMFEKAKKILGYDLFAICQDGPEEKLTETKYCQPAMFIGGLAGFERLRQENEEIVTRATCMAGFSLGEYTALCAAGVFSFEDGLKLVKLRGEAMQEAAEIGKQSMLSVVGLPKDKLEPLCKEAAKKAGPEGVCQIAISLFAEGYTVGGTEKACTILKDLAEKKAGAQQCRLLKAQGAFHTPLMKPAAERLAEALEEMLPRMKSPLHMVYMNATAEALRPGDDPSLILSLLKKQLTNPVLWDDAMKEIIEDKVTDFYEVGPSRQLKAMMKRIDATAWKVMENIEIGSKPRPPPPKTVGPNDESPLPVAILFPGQGSQVQGMLESCKDKPVISDMLKKANEILGYDVVELCKQDALALGSTEISAPIMFIAGLAGFELLREEKPDAANRCASLGGLSVGEYTAHCAAGSFSFEDGLRFLKIRGEIMAAVAKEHPGVLTSVVGLEKAKLESVCKEAAKAEGAGGVCELALTLFPSGITVAGTPKASAILADKAVAAGAQMAKEIGNYGYHSSCMQPAADKMEAHFKEFASKVKSPKHSVWCNATGEPLRPGCDPEEVIDTLKRMLTKCVLYEQMVKEMIKELKDPNAEYYEVGTGKQLKTMMKRIDQNAWKNMNNYEV